METKESKKQLMSKRMKNVYMSYNILHKLVLTKIGDKYVFLLDYLSQEEKDYIERQWCNTR